MSLDTGAQVRAHSVLSSQRSLARLGASPFVSARAGALRWTAWVVVVNALLFALLMLRYLAHDQTVLDDIFRRGDELNEDPLHGFLVGLRLFAEMMANLPEAHPGCLAASFCYQDQLFNKDIRELNTQGVLSWRRRFRERLEQIAQRYPPRQPVDFEAMADMAATCVEGALILGRLLQDPSILPRQVLLYRDLVRATLAPEEAR